MSQYFIHDGDHQTGPYTIEQLKEKRMLVSKMVWKEGMNDWAPANTIEELRGILATEPPPIQVSKDKSKNVGGWIAVITILIIGGFLTYKFVLNPDGDHSPDY